MTLAPGGRLGPYELVSELGRGGMGVVWRARDTTLRREVAIKVLPEAVAHDPERLSRFEREARTLGSLNHPCVAHLYGFEAAPHPFLVMELVPGHTLAERIARGPLPIDEAIEVFSEIARGLEAAHAKGVVHRDLKPANVKIADGASTSSGGRAASGAVKILDFGLAKALAPEAELKGGVALSESPTLTQAATLRGEILGTAAYMSPEQARGRAVDERADIWAFGVCLYEALTGSLPFAAEDAVATLAKVIETAPSFDALPAATPPSIRRLLRRCLVKRPENRLQSIGDARLELDEALSANASDGSAPAADGDRDRRSARRGALVLAAVAALVTGLVVGLALGRLGARSPHSAPPERFLVEADGIQNIDLTAGNTLAISPAGDELVFSAQREGVSQLWRRRLDRLDAEAIAGTEGALSAAYSKDGKWIAFGTDKSLMRVPAAGGLPTSLAAFGFLNFGFDWGDDGTLYFADDRDHIAMARLWAIPPEGGEPRRVNSLDSSPPNVSHSWPAILPDGDEILFAEWQHDEQSMELVAVETRSGRRHPLFSGSQPRYSATGHLIFTRPGSLWAAPFEPKSLAVLGPAVEIADDVATSPLTGRADYALSADGTLVYRRRVAPADAALFWIDRRGERSPVPFPSGRYDGVSLSPDGRKVALVNIADGSIRILDLASSDTTRIALEKSLTILPVWSRDSRQVAVLAVGAATGIYAVRVDAGGDPELLSSMPATGGLSVFSQVAWLDRPNGFLGQAGSSESSDVAFLHLGPPPRVEPLLATRFRESLPALSPDGRWLAYESDESGQLEVYIRSFADLGGGRWQASRGGGSQPVWSLDGDRLYHRRGDRILAVTVAAAVDGPRLGDPEEAFQLPDWTPIPFGGHPDFAIAKDGRLLGLVDDQLSSQRTAEQLVLIKNFASQLPRLAPAD